MIENTCLVTFAGTDIHKEYQREFHNLYGHLFSRHVAYTDVSIRDTEFYMENMQMFQYEKYFGYFLWKPYIIKKTLDMIPEQNVLYCDSNLRFTDVTAFEQSYKQLMNEQGVYLVKHEHFLNKDWTKRDTFILMRCDDVKYWNAHQVWTPLLGFSKAKQSASLLNDYLSTCRIPEIVTELPNLYGENLDGFREHRWEQSVLSILVEKYNLKGVSDTLAMNWVTKLYSRELLQYKDKINENPLKKSL